MTAIESVGVHVPRYRISADTVADARGGFDAAGVSSTAVAGPDEDTLTMAVEAAERAIESSSVDRSTITAVTVGTTTPPLDEADLTADLVAMLGLPETVESAAFTQSARAGTRALRTAIGLRDGPALVVASDAPVGAPDDALGQGAGAGAVAFVLADEGPVSVAETGSVTRPFPGTRYRERGETRVDAYGATAYERQAYTETVAAGFETVDGRDAALAPTAPDGSMPYRATNAMAGDPSVYQRASALGDTGAASAFFSLLAAWDEGEENVVVVGYGDGASADAIRLEGRAPVAESHIEAVDLDYPDYLRIRGEIVSTGGGR